LLFTIESNIEAFPFDIANTGVVDDTVEVLVISEWRLPPQLEDHHSPEIKYRIDFFSRYFELLEEEVGKLKLHSVAIWCPVI